MNWLPLLLEYPAGLAAPIVDGPTRAKATDTTSATQAQASGQ